jgi:fructose-bisphosphate aldolase class I
VLEEAGIIPGIKVDARFAKWRAVLSIGDGIPSDYAIWTNAHALGRYAALCQEAELVPIVEPEVLMDGEHSLDTAFHVTARTLQAVYTELHDQRVQIEGTLLKPNMVLPGYDSSEQVSHEEIAQTTIRCLKRVVPASVPGVVFLSGGQSDEDATARLNAMNAIGGVPWQLSFSYGRALQTGALRAWRGDSANVPAAQEAFHHRAKLNGAARYGRYSEEMERETAPVG